MYAVALSGFCRSNPAGAGGICTIQSKLYCSNKCQERPAIKSRERGGRGRLCQEKNEINRGV